MVKRKAVKVRVSKSAVAPHRAAPVLDDELVGAMSLGLKPVELSTATRDSLRSRIMQRIADRPPPLTTTIRASEMTWNRVNDLVEVALLRRDVANNNQTVLIRMQPGAEIVPHRHNLEEECLIVEGEIEIGAHRLYAGDMHIAQPGAAHAAIRTRTGALLMIRAEIPPSGFSLV
jgi:quercetin dioxygenase-like cupin family protein